MRFRSKTVKVVLENDWFTPYGFIKKGVDGAPVNIDEKLIPILPKSAQIVGDDYVANEDSVILPTPQNMGTLARDLYDQQFEEVKAAVAAGAKAAETEETKATKKASKE